MRRIASSASSSSCWAAVVSTAAPVDRACLHAASRAASPGSRSRIRAGGDLSLERRLREARCRSRRGASSFSNHAVRSDSSAPTVLTGWTGEVEPRVRGGSAPGRNPSSAPIARRQQVGLAEEHHGRNSRTVEGPKEGEVFLIERRCRVHKDHAEIASRQVGDRLGPARRGRASRRPAYRRRQRRPSIEVRAASPGCW